MTEGHNTVETTSVSATIDTLVQKGLAALEEMRKLGKNKLTIS